MLRSKLRWECTSLALCCAPSVAEPGWPAPRIKNDAAGSPRGTAGCYVATCLVLLKMLKKILAPHHQLIEHTDIFCILRLIFTLPPKKNNFATFRVHLGNCSSPQKISSSVNIPSLCTQHITNKIYYACIHSFYQSATTIHYIPIFKESNSCPNSPCRTSPFSKKIVWAITGPKRPRWPPTDLENVHNPTPKATALHKHND